MPSLNLLWGCLRCRSVCTISATQLWWWQCFPEMWHVLHKWLLWVQDTSKALCSLAAYVVTPTRVPYFCLFSMCRTTHLMHPWIVVYMVHLLMSNCNSTIAEIFRHMTDWSVLVFVVSNHLSNIRNSVTKTQLPVQSFLEAKRVYVSKWEHAVKSLNVLYLSC